MDLIPYRAHLALWGRHAGKGKHWQAPPVRPAGVHTNNYYRVPEIETVIGAARAWGAMRTLHAGVRGVAQNRSG